jgi:phosphocarrier protein
MVSDKITITNPKGLHLRSSGIFCKEAMRFKSHITFGAKGSTANAKSVLSVLGACVRCGDVIELSCNGEDEAVALEAMRNIIETGLA